MFKRQLFMLVLWFVSVNLKKQKLSVTVWGGNYIVKCIAGKKPFLFEIKLLKKCISDVFYLLLFTEWLSAVHCSTTTVTGTYIYIRYPLSFPVMLQCSSKLTASWRRACSTWSCRVIFSTSVLLPFSSLFKPWFSASSNISCLDTLETAKVEGRVGNH